MRAMVLAREPDALDFLPGQLVIERGTVRDYRRLEHFHYTPGDPATWAGVWRCTYDDRVIAVAVLSYPTLASRARLIAIGKPARRSAFLNLHVRTISRVIVHPQFRALGIASRLVRRVCQDCPTRYVEAIAAMGRVHPLFERGGMRRVDRGNTRKAYFIFDGQRDGKGGGR